MSVTEEIKNRLDIVDVISEHVQLRKSGRNYAAFCPFHSNTRTPAFYVFPETQTWHCFGACAEGGDVFSFVMKRNGWDFKEALTDLADRAGVALKEYSPEEKARARAADKLGDLVQAAADYFHQLLLHAPQAAAVRDYVAERGLSAETQTHFQLGFALDSWDACRTHFNAQGHSDQELLDAGLLTENPDKGTRYDRFRNRLMIPIRDVSGRIVGFGARTLDPEGVPKYLNSPQTALFDKSRLLYGLDSAKRQIREARQAVIVEGYMDVMQAWQAGYGNTVAQMGTALTSAQLSLLKRYTREFVLALDADAAGAQATMRSLQVAREVLDRDMEVRFDARGLIRHEGRLKAAIKVVTLPEGKDPDQIIRADPEQWPQLLAQARPVVEYVIRNAVASLDPNDGKGKAAVARQVLPLIGDVAEPVEREHYRQVLARALGVDERALRRVSRGRRSATKEELSSTRPLPSELSTAGSPEDAPALSGSRPIARHLRQANFLRQSLQYPRLILKVNNLLASVAADPVRREDFASAEDKVLLGQVYERSAAATVAPLEELWDSLDVPLVERVQTLLRLPVTSLHELDRLPTTLVLSVLDWRTENIRELTKTLEHMLQNAQEQGDLESVRECQRGISEQSRVLGRLHKARNAMKALNQRRAAEQGHT